MIQWQEKPRRKHYKLEAIIFALVYLVAAVLMYVAGTHHLF